MRRKIVRVGKRDNSKHKCINNNVELENLIQLLKSSLISRIGELFCNKIFEGHVNKYEYRKILLLSTWD
jgi:hypothetical protein